MVSRVYGDTYGYLTIVELLGFAGMAVDGLLMSTWGGFKNGKTTLLCGLIVFGTMAFYGVALTTVQTAITALLQEKTEASMQGRVFGLLGSVYSGFMPVGMALFS